MSANPKFLLFFSKTKFALELSINVMEIEKKNNMLISRGRPAGSQLVKGWAYWVPGGLGVGLQGLRGSRDRATWFRGGKG